MRMHTRTRPQLREARVGTTPRRLAALGLALALALSTAAPAAAQSAPRKAGRGLAAMTTGFLELPGQIVETSRERGPAWGATLGFVKGLGGIVVRELVGVYEFVTSPFPVPAGYRPILEPEFPWGYFDEGRAGGAEPVETHD
jgi:putative exosortase-associated protein (TIGR04073 family)